jgi:hypothetical protein
MTAEIKELRSNDPLTNQLQTELHTVLMQEKFARLQNCAVIGILEYLKWNLINMSDR